MDSTATSTSTPPRQPRALRGRSTPDPAKPLTARGRARSHPKPPNSRLAEVKARRQKFNEETRFFVLNCAQIRISVDLAREIGDRESIMLLQYEFWLATEGIEVGDKRAVHDSYRTLHRFFSFWSYATTQRTFVSLVEQGLLYTTATPGGKNDGRYVFINFENAKSLKSIVVAEGPGRSSPPPPAPDDTPGDAPDSTPGDAPDSTPDVPDEKALDVNNEVPDADVYQDETPVPQPKQEYHADTPSLFGVYRSDTPSYHYNTPASHSDTSVFQADTPENGPYKERAGAVERGYENGESVGVVPAREISSDAHDPTPHALHALFYEPDVQILLAVFGFNTDRPDTLKHRDWQVLPNAVAFMRREKITGGELRAFSEIGNSRWPKSPYLSQLETDFYKLLPARARAKSRQIEADNAPIPAPQTVASSAAAPAQKAASADELPDGAAGKRQRALRACADVFLNLPESEQVARREEAVEGLGPLHKDVYIRNINKGQDMKPGTVHTWREGLLQGVWNEHHAACVARMNCMDADQNTELDLDELGAIPILEAYFHVSPSEVPASTDVAQQSGTSLSFAESQVPPMRATMGDVAGSLLNQWRPSPKEVLPEPEQSS